MGVYGKVGPSHCLVDACLGCGRGTVVAESRPASGRYTLRTIEEAPRQVGGCRPCVSPGMMAARRSLHLDPAP